MEALMHPIVQTFFDTATFTASHLVSDPASRAAVIIDPVLDYEPNWATISTVSADRVLDAVAKQGLDLLFVLETHAHADHLSAAHYIREKTGAKVAIGAQITRVQETFFALFEITDQKPDGSAFDILLRQGDRLALGSLNVEVLHTPGHTPACVTYLIGDAAFVGDTLFMPDYGTARADFPGGDAATLFRSIQKILALPDETRVFVGHDYLPKGREVFQWETTVKDERTSNIQVRQDIDELHFVTTRQARDATLAAPTLILPSLQINVRGGALPPPSAGGKVFLKLPVTIA
jgi:glyoxylase-like metal-dependent hydrolase (beta-lactamase superfamily II)